MLLNDPRMRPLANAKLLCIHYIHFVHFRRMAHIINALKYDSSGQCNPFSQRERLSVWLLSLFFFLHSSYCIKDTIISGHKKVFCRNEINGFKPTLLQPYLIYLVLTNCHSVFKRNFTKPNLWCSWDFLLFIENVRLLKEIITNAIKFFSVCIFYDKKVPTKNVI